MPLVDELPTWSSRMDWLEAVAARFESMFPGESKEDLLSVALLISQRFKGRGSKIRMKTKAISWATGIDTADVFGCLETLEDLGLLSSYVLKIGVGWTKVPVQKYTGLDPLGWTRDLWLGGLGQRSG